MRNFFRKLHLWVSVSFGLVIVVTCFTGAMLVFEKEITDICNSDVLCVEPVGEPLPFDILVESVEKTLPEGVEVTGIVVPAGADEAYKVNISKPRRAAVYVNQYTGVVTGKQEQLGFFNIMLRLHRWLMDTRPQDGGIYWGKMIVGASTIAFVVILLTGLFIWWPRSRKMLANRLKIVTSKGKRRFWYDLHVAGGFYVLLLLLAMALTGLTWSYEWYRNGLYVLFGADEGKSAVVNSTRVAKVSEPVFASTKDVKSDTLATVVDGTTAATKSSWNTDGTTGATASSWEADGTTGATVVEELSKYALWEKAVAQVMKDDPAFAQVTVSDGTVTVKHDGWGNQRASDKYMFDESTGEVTSVQRYDDTPVKSRIGGWVYSLHTGNWGGIVVKILYFLAALLGATLPLTGYYLWIKRVYGKRKSK